MSMEKDFRLIHIAPKYKKAITTAAERVSASLNNQMVNYDQSINALRSLVNTGAVLNNYAQILNQSLVMQLKALRSKQGDNFQSAPMTINPLSESKANDLLDSFVQTLEQGETEQFFLEFEHKLISLFYQEGSEHSGGGGLIQFDIHQNSKGEDFDIFDMNYDALVEAYLVNYSKLLVDENAVLEWDRELLSGYIMFLENKIYKINDDIGDKIKDIVISEICQPVLSQKNTLVLEGEYIDLLKRDIVKVLNKLVVEKNRHFDQLISNYKFKFVSAVNDLFEKINLEQFPHAVNNYIEKQKTEDESFFDVIIAKTQALHQERDDIEAELKERNLKFFISYPATEFVIADQGDLLFSRSLAKELFDSLFEAEQSPLDIFMSERKELSEIIAGQLNQEDGKYALLIKDVNEFKTSGGVKNKINLALLNSLESLAIDLKNRYLNSLSLDYLDFLESSDYKAMNNEFNIQINQSYEYTKNVVFQLIQRFQQDILQSLVSAKFDDLNTYLPDELIEATINSWFAKNEKNPKWRKFNIWSPDKEELNVLVEQMLADATQSFFKKLENKSSIKIDQLPMKATVVNSIKKLFTLPLDALKAVVVVNSYGAVLPLLTHHEETQVPKVCTNTIESVLNELKDELSEKELSEARDALLEKSGESAEAFKDLLEKYQNSNSNVFAKLGKKALAKLNERYNPFDNKEVIVKQLTKKIMDLRKELSTNLDASLKQSVAQKLQEMESFKLDDNIVQDVLDIN